MGVRRLDLVCSCWGGGGQAGRKEVLEGLHSPPWQEAPTMQG